MNHDPSYLPMDVDSGPSHPPTHGGAGNLARDSIENRRHDSHRNNLGSYPDARNHGQGTLPNEQQDQNTLIIQQLRHELQDHKRSLATIQNKMLDKDQTIRELGNTLHKRDRERSELQLELNRAKSSQQSAERRMQDIQCRVDELNLQLKDSHNHIFSLQPVRSSITETEAQAGFESLVSAVERWVDNRLQRILDDLEDGQLHDKRCDSALAKGLLSFVGPAAQRHFGTLESDLYHVTAMIMEYLCTNIFNRGFYCPLEENPKLDTYLTGILDEVETGMITLGRDPKSCRLWRVDALTALAKQPKFKALETKHAQFLAEQLTSLLSILNPYVNEGELRDSVLRNIIKPAMQLASGLHLSTDIYSVEWTTAKTQPHGHMDEKQHVFMHYICRNLLDDGQTMKLPLRGATTGEKSIHYLFDICPGLSVQKDRHDLITPKKMLCKPIILAAVSEGSQISFQKGDTLLEWLRMSVASS